MKHFALLLIGLLVFQAAHCPAFADEPVKKIITEGEVKGDNITGVTAGETFTIEMESNRTTGYEWQLAEPVDKDRLEFVISEYVPDTSGRMGAGGKERWTFKAIGPGNPVIHFKYVRPWEKDAPPAEKKSFVVMIKER
ncbi:MAG: protease inhibitor I42 family protein [Candidatus Omnitrophica bacterium]|nr:protease inhibitor I42 family protein [Candidatus Omnitrophota bacterium]